MLKKHTTTFAIFVFLFLVIMLAFFIFNMFGQPFNVFDEEPLHKPYLIEFLADTGLIANPAMKDNLSYYELNAVDGQLVGFVFFGAGEGWGGPIELFVKTDLSGVIERMHVWQHAETPLYVYGLDEFLESFTTHRAEAELIWHEDVHGLTGATMTAEAIIEAVNALGRAAYEKGIFKP